MFETVPLSHAITGCLLNHDGPNVDCSGTGSADILTHERECERQHIARHGRLKHVMSAVGSDSKKILPQETEDSSEASDDEDILVAVEKLSAARLSVRSARYSESLNLRPLRHMALAVAAHCVWNDYYASFILRHNVHRNTVGCLLTRCRST